MRISSHWLISILALTGFGGLATAAAGASDFIGSHACRQCHEAEYAAWSGSHHAKAMQEAGEHSVLGDFENAGFEYAGITTRFFRRDGRYFVHTDGADGKMADFEITHTFGLAPLQQYLVTFPDGRLQALSIAWDSRPPGEGGQRWFHLYPGHNINHQDPLHWTGPQFNWNFMCADCHSTHVDKNYSTINDTFQTSWSEISVGCEACHGPGERHIARAGGDHEGLAANPALSVVFDDRRDVRWQMNPLTGNAARSQVNTARKEIETCAGCHSRRSLIAPGHEGQASFLEHFMPALLTEGLYHPDGQILEEVYVWGSFTQSRMFEAGVTCSDCHDPHDQELRIPGNGVCLQCHSAGKYETGSHHHHPAGTAGAECAACHMPETTYMLVDPRRDHSLRIPRPDQSLQHDTPNACNACHEDRAVEWAAEQAADWYGDMDDSYQDWAAAFSLARQGKREAAALLSMLAADRSRPDITRATAVHELADFLDQATLSAVQIALSDPAPLARIAALGTLERLAPDQRYPLASHLVTDPVKAVRLEAGRILAASLPALQGREHDQLQAAIAEYVRSQELHADRVEYQVNLGNLYRNIQDLSQAERKFRKALSMDPQFEPAWVNLSDLYRVAGQAERSVAVLREGVAENPASGLLHHSLGLALVRAGDTGSALSSLQTALDLDPGSARFAYVLGVAFHSTGSALKAMEILEKAHSGHPRDRDILLALATMHRDAGQWREAERFASDLLQLDPSDPGAQSLVKSIQSLTPGQER